MQPLNSISFSYAVNFTCEIALSFHIVVARDFEVLHLELISKYIELTRINRLMDIGSPGTVCEWQRLSADVGKPLVLLVFVVTSNPK